METIQDNPVRTDPTDEKQDSRLPAAYVTDGFFVKPIGEDMRIKICYVNIVWVEAENSYSHIHLTTGKHVSVAHNIQRLEVLLPKDYFIRVSRSEIINIRCVYKYYGNTLYVMGSSRPFTVSKNMREYVFSCFNSLEK